MVVIPAGTNAGTDPDDGQWYTLTIPVTVNPLYMDAAEITKSQWDVVYNWAIQNGYSFDNPGSGKGPDHPVQTVNWYDCVKWCNARSQMNGRTPCYEYMGHVYKAGSFGQDGSQAVACDFTANGYRLPTIDEWGYAARGGVEGTRYPWGDTIVHSNANYYSDSYYSYDVSPTRGYHPGYNDGVEPYTSPAGSFAPNGYGLYDMVGNVWEWCWDFYDDAEYGQTRIQRGGSWWNYANRGRLGAAYIENPNASYDDLGFRTVFR
jgi:formylglycine-generating enzyme required for sulfatase activity